jgi:hypothetical protein
VQLNGKWSSDGRWLQVDNGGWVYASQLQTDLKRPKVASSSRRSYSAAPDDEEYIVSDGYGDGYYGDYTDTGIIYGGPYVWGPSFGGYWGGGRPWRSGHWDGNHHGNWSGGHGNWNGGHGGNWSGGGNVAFGIGGHRR